MTMKWYGWGDEKVTFPMDVKPLLWPYIVERIGFHTPHPEKKGVPIERSSIKLRQPHLVPGFLEGLEASGFTPRQLDTTEQTRLVHSYGKSYPDLFRVRRGEVPTPPDMVIFPKSHAEVETLVSLANTHNICLIPFGGGTNIVGGANSQDVTHERRMLVTVSLKEMNTLLRLDPTAHTATFEAGILGPDLEKALKAHGWSLGHHPDSFEYSTLGGWIATRSAGMQSDAYGKIEEMVVSVKMVTPTGTLETKAVPASSAGPDLNRLVAGSEGTLGIITEATMRVHRAPQVKDYRGFIFPSFAKGVEAIQECLESGWTPSLIRLQDEEETQLALHSRKPKGGLQGLIQKGLKQLLRATGYGRPSILVVGFEGNGAHPKAVSRKAIEILKKHKAFPLGASVGQAWSEDKYNIPYLRDYVMDYGVMVDVSETSALWPDVLKVHSNTLRAIQERFKTHGDGFGYVGCHISHTYKTGACLYFTYATKQLPGQEIEQYYGYKNMITQTFLDNGAALTHHHAVGLDHKPWLRHEVSETGFKSLWALKNTLDPKGILNPGKLLESEPVLQQKEDAEISGRSHPAARSPKPSPHSSTQEE